MNLEIDRTPHEITFNDLHSSYRLHLRTDPKATSETMVAFTVGELNELRITGRDMVEYDARIKAGIDDPQAQYVEVGPGLGEYVHAVLTSFPGGLNKRPIVIDVADYLLIEEILASVLKSGIELPAHITQRIEIVRGRCQTILDDSKVQLFNMPLSSAVRIPQLQDCADRLVDWFAATFYPEIDLRNDLSLIGKPFGADSLLMQLLKPGGKLYTLMSLALNLEQPRSLKDLVAALYSTLPLPTVLESHPDEH